MKVKNLSGIVMRIAAVLICLVLFSAHLASGMFARYVISAKEDSSARVASYHVEIVPADNNQSDALGATSNNGDVSYRFIVDNSKTDVAVKYSLSVAFYDSVTDTALDKFNNVKIDNFDPVEIKDEPDSNRHVYVFDITDELKPHSTSAVHTLTFNTSLSWTEAVDYQLADTAIQVNTGNKYPVEVFADVTQIN